MWLILSLGVRIIGLEKSPNTLNHDESSLGYNAYSLLQTGKDEYGNSWPISLRSFNDYKPALYAYLSIPAIYLWGLNQSSVRLVSAIFGTISLWFWFLIFKKISKEKNSKVLLAGLLISFLPWRLHFSRVAFESNLATAFFLMMVWCLLNWKKGKIYKTGTILAGVAAIYSYHSARLAVPCLVWLFILDPLGKRIRFKNWWVVVVIGLMSLPIFLSGRLILRRFDQTNIFRQYYPFVPKELVQTKNPWREFRANPIYFLGGIIFGHLGSYLSPRNLALDLYHWIDKSAMAISGTGMLGWLSTIMLLWGIGRWLKGIRTKRNYRILIYWIAAGVLPAVITREWFHPLRALNSFPALEIIAGLGIVQLLDGMEKIRSRQIRWGAVAILIIIVGISGLFNLLNEYKFSVWEHYGEFQPGGYKEGAELLNSLKDKYQTIYIDSPHAQNYIFFLFYMKYPPEKIQKYAEIRPMAGMGTEGFLNFNFDNFIFKKYDWPNDRNKNNFVYWTSAEVKEEEMSSDPGVKLRKICDVAGRWTASIITKE